MKESPKDYNNYYRIARKLDEKDGGFLLKLNKKSKNKSISKKNENRIFTRFLKIKIEKYDYVIKELPELEKGFRKVWS